MLMIFLVSVYLNLLGEEAHILQIIDLFKLVVMFSDHILLSLLPGELIFFKFPHVLQLFAFLLETVMSLLIYFLEVTNKLLSLSLGVIIDFEWALGSQEVRVGIVMIVAAYLLSVKS